MIAQETNGDVGPLLLKKQELRNVTNNLKNLDVVGKLNDEVLLGQIRTLGKLPE